MDVVGCSMASEKYFGWLLFALAAESLRKRGDHRSISRQAQIRDFCWIASLEAETFLYVPLKGK